MTNSQNVIKDTFKQVRNLFVWACDMEQFGVPEHWASNADDVEQGRVFRQDCDGFSLTCAELLERRGFETALLRIALCWTETNGYHAVCVADGLILDNRQRVVWHWVRLPYKWDKSMRLNELGVWRSAS